MERSTLDCAAGKCGVGIILEHQTMALIGVVCPHGQGDEAVVKHGMSAEGKQRFRCRSEV